MSHSARQTLFLRYVLVFLSPPSIFTISTLSARTHSFSFTQNTIQAHLCLLLCAPLAASSLVSAYVVYKSHRSQRKNSSVDAALVLALDVIMGSVLLLTAVAGWFIMRAESMLHKSLDPRFEVWARWGVVPLVIAFCIHYFLAFASLENGVLLSASGGDIAFDSTAEFRNVLFADRKGTGGATPFLTFDWEKVPEKDPRVLIGWSSNSV
ncbi:hypothetical protein EJ05DRAFT_472316, partial [Pseudovirgaria hyperparasitica]